MPDMYILDPENDQRRLEIDEFFRGAVTVRDEHHAVHGGYHYFLSGFSTLAADGEIDLQFTTPDTTKLAHMTFLIRGTGETVLGLYEDATVANGGATLTPFNNYRDLQSTNPSGLVLAQTGGSVIAAGSDIFPASFGVTDNPVQSEGGFSLRTNEIIFKRDSTYRLFMESNSADNIVGWIAEWYEKARGRA